MKAPSANTIRPIHQQTLQNRKRLEPHAFNGQFISPSDNAEVSLLAPTLTPAVLDAPEGHSVLLAPPHQQHRVVGHLERVEAIGRVGEARGFLVDASSVKKKHVDSSFRISYS